MAHFAEVDDDNKVIRVLVVPDEYDEETEGQNYLSQGLGLGGRWIKASYTSRAGIRFDPETGEDLPDPAFRKNFPSVGWFYNEELDGFVAPRPEEEGNWVFSEETGLWFDPDFEEPNYELE